MKPCDQIKPLLMGMLDHELSPEETEAVNEHLTRCPACRQEFSQLRESSRPLAEIRFAEPHDAVLDRLWKSPYSRLSRATGLILVIGGYLALIAYSLYEFFISNNEAAVPKIAVGAILLGFFVLLGHVVRERLKSYSTDPYKGIQR